MDLLPSLPSPTAQNVVEWANATAETQWGGWDDEGSGAPFSDASSSGSDDDEHHAGSSAESSSEEGEETEGETPPQTPSPRKPTREELKAQVYGISPARGGSPLQQALAFRNGSFARFSRPDSADADAAKATLIEASDDAWGALDASDPWLSPQAEQPTRKARSKSAQAGGRKAKTSSMVDRALAQAAAQAAARRPNSSPGGSQQFALDNRPTDLGVRRREWGPSMPRRPATSAGETDSEFRSKRASSKEKDPASVRLMRWSNAPPDHGMRKAPTAANAAANANGGGIVAATASRDREPQKDWIKELYQRRQRIAKRGKGQARIDTRITTDTQAQLADILGKNEAALGAAESEAADSAGSLRKLWPTQADPPPQLRWRPARAASAPPRPLSGVGVKERQAAAAVHSSLSGALGTTAAAALRPSNRVAATPATNGSAATPSRAAPAASGGKPKLSGGGLANLTNRQSPHQVSSSSSVGQRQAPPVHFNKVSTVQTASSAASVSKAGLGSGTAPALAHRAAVGGSSSAVTTTAAAPSSSSCTSLAARTVVVRRGRPASAAVVGAPSTQQHQQAQTKLPGGGGPRRRPVSAGPFYPNPSGGSGGGGSGGGGGMSEASVRSDVAAEAARRNATLLKMRPTSSGSSRRGGPSLKPVKRPLVYAVS
jgi:hypothetical protein